MRFIITILLLFFSFWQDGWTDDYRQWYLPEEATMRLGKGKVFDIAFSPNGKHFAVASSIGIWIYDARTYKEIALVTEDWENISSVETTKITFSQDGSTFATIIPKYGSSRIRIRIWNAYTGRKKAYVKEGPNSRSSAIAAFALSPDGSTLAYWSYDKKIRLWDTRTGEHKATLTDQLRSVFAFSPDGNTLVSTSENANSIQLWDLETIQLTKTIPIGDTKKVNWLAFLSDTILATGNLNETVRFWVLETLEHTKITLNGNAEFAPKTAFSPTTRMLATATEDGILQLWDLQTGQSEVLPAGSTSRISSLAFSPDGLKLACAWIDGTIRFYNVNTQQHIANITGHCGQTTSSLAYLQEGKILTDNGELWKPKTDFSRLVLSTHFGTSAFITFSPDGKKMANPSYEKIFLSHASTGVPITTLTGHYNNVGCVAFSPDGLTLASGSSGNSGSTSRLDFTIRLWDVLSGQHKITLSGHTKGINCVAFSPDGKSLASGSEDKTIRLWNPKTGEHKLTLIGHTGSVTGVAFSPDGKTLASASYVLRNQYNRNPDYAIWLWDLQTGKHKTQLSGHTEHVLAVAFSPDGKTLASGSEDKTIRLWSIQTTKHLTTLKGHVNTVFSVTFSPDGQCLASSSGNGTILLWDLSEK